MRTYDHRRASVLEARHHRAPLRYTVRLASLDPSSRFEAVWTAEGRREAVCRIGTTGEADIVLDLKGAPSMPPPAGHLSLTSEGFSLELDRRSDPRLDGRRLRPARSQTRCLAFGGHLLELAGARFTLIVEMERLDGDAARD